MSQLLERKADKQSYAIGIRMSLHQMSCGIRIRLPSSCLRKPDIIDESLVRKDRFYRSSNALR